MKSEKVSVIVPIYNPKKKWLKECLESIEHQTYEKIEIVIVDDSPNANHESMVSEILGEDFYFINNEKNLGIPKTRNKGVSESEGEFFTILDQDDILLEEKIEKQVERFRENENLGMVLTNVIHIDGEGNKVRKRDFNRKLSNMNAREIAKHQIELLLGKGDAHPPLTTEMIRRNVYEKVGKYDNKLYGMNDRDIMIRIACNGYEIGLVNDFLLKRRYHGENASNSIELIKDRRVLIEKLVEIFPKFRKYKPLIDRKTDWLITGNYFFSNQPVKFTKNYSHCLIQYPLFTIINSCKFLKKKLMIR